VYGRVVEDAAERRVEENTILIFSSDHGDMLHSTASTENKRPWDESLRVPMLWHYPAGPGKRRQAL